MGRQNWLASDDLRVVHLTFDVRFVFLGPSVVSHRGDPSKEWVPRESPEISLSGAERGSAKAEQVAWKCTGSMRY